MNSQFSMRKIEEISHPPGSRKLELFPTNSQLSLPVQTTVTDSFTCQMNHGPNIAIVLEK